MYRPLAISVAIHAIIRDKRVEMATSTCGDEERDYNTICPICQDEFKDPVIIDCHHSFCRTCINTWIKRSNTRDTQDTVLTFASLHSNGRFKCPSCKSTNNIPFNGVAGFAKSFYIQQIKDIKAKSLSSYPKCPKHKTEDLRFYCMECETTMCRDCKVLKHEGHSAECVADVSNDMRAKLRDHINKTNADIRKLTLAKEACTVDKTKVIKLKQSARTMVKNHVQEMKRTIDNIAGVLDQNICSYFQAYEDDIDRETSEADSKTERQERFKASVGQEIKTGSDHSVIDHFKGFLKERGQIVVADRKPPNPDYKTKLPNVYQKGNINVFELQTMVGAIAGESKALKHRNIELAPKEVEEILDEIGLSTDRVAVFTKTDKC